MKQAVQIMILGQQYTIRSEISPEETLRVAAFVNDWITDAAAVGRSADTLNTAVLALLNLGGAYLRLKEGRAPDEAVQRLHRLLEKLEQAVPAPDQPGDWRGPGIGQ